MGGRALPWAGTLSLGDVNTPMALLQGGCLSQGLRPHAGGLCQRPRRLLAVVFKLSLPKPSTGLTAAVPRLGRGPIRGAGPPCLGPQAPALWPAAGEGSNRGTHGVGDRRAVVQPKRSPES